MRKKAASIQGYLRKPYSRILIVNEDGTYTAEILEFHGCFAEGNTPDEAIHNLDAAAQDWIKAAIEAGQEIPEPAFNAGYSGHLALRLPRSLHRQAARLAERDGVSLNQFLITTVAARVGAEDLYARLVDRLAWGMAVTAADFVVRVAPHFFQPGPAATAGSEVITLEAPSSFGSVLHSTTGTATVSTNG